MDRVLARAGILVFLLAPAIRLVGIGWGLPNGEHYHSFHPDEGIVFAATRAIEPTEGDFAPGFYNYGTLYLTAMRLVGDVATVVGGHRPQGTVAEQVAWQASMLLCGRVISALSGALVALFAFLIARRIAGRGAAIVAGLAVAIAPGLTVHSRFATVDMLGAALTTATLWAAFELRAAPPERRMRWAVTAGLLAGAAAGTKYLGGAALLAPILASLRPREIAVQIGTFLAAFVIATPGIIVDRDAFIRDFRYEMTHTATGHGLVFIGRGHGLPDTLANFFAAYGTVLTLLGLGALFVYALRKREWVWPLLGFVAVYLFFIAKSEVRFVRYVFPLIPVLAIAFGAAIAGLYRMEYKSRSISIVVLAFAFLGLDFGGLRGTVMSTLWMSGPDPRELAVAALRQDEGVGRVGLASDPWFYTPPLWPSAGVARSVPLDRRIEDMTANARPPAVLYLPANEPFFDWDVRLLTETAPETIVISSQESYDPARLGGRTGIGDVPELVARRYAEFRRELESRYDLARVFGSDGLRWAPFHDLMYVRPEITVWRKRKSG